MEGELLHPPGPVGGRVPKVFHRWCRQCGVEANAADSNWIERYRRGTHGKEHHDEEGNSGSHR